MGCQEIIIYLTDVGRGWESELVSLDIEGQVRHLADVVTIHNILSRGRER